MDAIAGYNPYSRRGPAAGEMRIGYVPLIDAAPLIVAREHGLFARHGLRVRLTRALGWGTIRDEMVYRELDAAHAPAGLLFTLLNGIQAPVRDVRALMLLNLQGNAITLSKRLWQKGARDAKSLRQVMRLEAPRKMSFAIVSWTSTHHYLFRTFLQQAGIDPDRDVQLCVLPPALVGEHMREGIIDGFCAGEPWSSAAVMRGDGWIAATSHDLAPLHPEKILLVPGERLDARPEEFAALREAVREACAYCDRPENRPQLAALLHRQLFPHLPLKAVENSLIGPCDLGASRTAEPGSFARFHDAGSRSLTSGQAMELLRQLEATHSLKLSADQRRHAVAAYLNHRTSSSTSPT